MPRCMNGVVFVCVQEEKMHYGSEGIKLSISFVHLSVVYVLRICERMWASVHVAVQTRCHGLGCWEYLRLYLTLYLTLYLMEYLTLPCICLCLYACACACVCMCTDGAKQ